MKYTFGNSSPSVAVKGDDSKVSRSLSLGMVVGFMGLILDFTETSTT